MASPITTHVLDTRIGKPAAGIGVAVFRGRDDEPVATGTTDADGRADALLEGTVQPGTYRLRFDTGAYFGAQQVETLYPHVEITFEIVERAHYHIPLLLNPYGYTTYRGS